MAFPRLGIIGIGRMGAPMSRRLMEAGYALTVHDRSADAVGALVAAGAESAASPAAVAEAADVVLLSLPTPDIVHIVAFGANGIATVAGAGKTVVDLSTTGPEGAKALAAGLYEKSFAILDCPVSGGVGGAEKGTLALMASGDADVYAALKPMLEVLGKPFLVGPDPGMGQMTKVMNNLLSVAALAVTSEALVLGKKAGLDPKVLIEVINVSSGQSNASMTKIPKYVLSRTFDFGFAIGLSNKDIRLCIEQANALGVPMVVGSSVLELLKIANASLGPDADLTEIIRPIEEWADVTVEG